MTMDAVLIDHALVLILDDPTIGNWAADQTDQRLGRSSPGRPGNDDDDPGNDDDDPEWWGHYTAIINELLEAVRTKNQPAA
jgi:hypothetical protein